MEAVLVPIKNLAEGKLRLAGMLPPRQRRRLGLAMLRDVLHTARYLPLRFVVTSDTEALALADEFNYQRIVDPGAGLNEALQRGTEMAIQSGASRLLILPSDIPLVSAQDLARLFMSKADVAMVSTRDGGTGALLRTPPDVIPASFGHESARLHLGRAKLNGLYAEMLDIPSIALDVDEPEDLLALARSGADRISVTIAAELTSGASRSREGAAPG